MRLITISLQLELESRGNRANLIRHAENAIARPGGCVNSSSGATASAAINYCEKNGIPYSVEAQVIMEGGGHHYFVKRLDVPKTK